MAVALRLSRGGSKKRPYFRIVAADIRAPRDGRYLERLGTYNPMKEKNDPERVTLNTERIKYWLSVGAKPTERVQKFLAAQKLAEKPTITKQTKQDKPKKKTLEKIKAKEEKLKAKQDEAAKATEKPAEAPPAPEQATTEKPAEASSTPEQATAEKSAEASPTPEQATAEKPAEASPAPEQATTEKPAEASSTPEQATAEKSEGEKS